MRLKKANERRTLRNPFRTTKKEHELLAREAFAVHPKFSMNDYICRRLFKRNGEERLEELRAIQRSAGVADSRFLHRSEKRARGLKDRSGRTPWLAA